MLAPPLLLRVLPFIWFVLAWDAAAAQDATIRIDAAQERHRLSPLLAGACIEDVNHEIYGGLYSQMIFGESFQEPALASPVEGLVAYGGHWKVADGVLESSAGEGNKIVAEAVAVRDGEASVDVRFDDAAAGNAGLIVRTSKPGIGADRFYGYEIALDPERQVLRLGRHRNDYQLLRDVPCEIPIGQWVELRVRLAGARIEIYVNGEHVVTFNDDDARGLETGAIGLRQFHRAARYRNLRHAADARETEIPFVERSAAGRAVSRMWQPFRTGDAQATYELTRNAPFVGAQSQEIEFAGGAGAVGIANRGLNGWGLSLQEGRPYEAELYVRAEHPCDVEVALENDDGSQVLAAQPCRVDSSDWTKVAFTLTPSSTVRDGRLTVKLAKPGKLAIGYVFLQPGAWGRFHDLPVRRDVAELLQRQGVRILRYGGTMINNDEYRWQKMIGPRATRPPYDGHWYDYSTNGWGIVDFMNFCEAAGFEYVPTLCMGETPESLAAFVAYATAPVDSEWGAKRARDGHPQPYRLKYLQLGNEERVDVDFAERFEERAKAIWEVGPQLQLVVGDFMYDDPITNPNEVTGAASGIGNLDGQRKILEFAQAAGHEVWFDLHVWTDGPGRHPTLAGMFSFIDALEEMKTGAKFKVVVFEFNANNHEQRRAVGNALALNAIERDGRLPIALSANCLQPDGQNDNGWDQGLLFLNPAQAWLQPPGFVTQIYSAGYQPRLVACEVVGASELDCTAKLSEDGRSMTCTVVNPTDQAIDASVETGSFKSASSTARITQLSAPPAAVNTASSPQNVTPASREEKITPDAPLTFPPFSVTTIVWD